MSLLAVQGGATGTGTVTLLAPVTNTDRTITLPDATGTVALQGGTGVGKVLQVVSTARTASSITTSTSFVSNGLTASITPSSASNKIFVSVSSIADSGGSAVTAFFTLYRNSTNLGGATEGFGGVSASLGNIRAPVSFNYLDSPSTTSSVSYTLYFRSSNGTQVEVPPYSAGVQSITLMEIAA